MDWIPHPRSVVLDGEEGFVLCSDRVREPGFRPSPCNFYDLSASIEYFLPNALFWIRDNEHRNSYGKFYMREWN